MYKFTDHAKKNGQTVGITLSTDKWIIRLTSKNGYIHVSVLGPNRYRRQGLSNVKSELTSFEYRVTALHFFRLAREAKQISDPHNFIDHANYADVFGSCFD